jgi:hypothetical protein
MTRFSFGCTWSNFVGFGNALANFQVNVASDVNGLRLVGAVMNGETSFSTPHGFYAGSSSTHSEAILESCSFGVTVAHGTDDIGWNNVPSLHWRLVNCLFTTIQAMPGSSDFSAPCYGSWIRVQKYNQTAGDHRTFTTTGTIKTDTSIFRTASPSARCTPNSSGYKLNSPSKKMPANSGQTITAAVYVRKSAAGDGAAYTGNQPRLIVRRNPGIGITSDTVLATYSSGTGSFNQISGAAATLTGDGVLEFYVDCDGTAGWINVDDWTFTVA